MTRKQFVEDLEDIVITFLMLGVVMIAFAMGFLSYIALKEQEFGIFWLVGFLLVMVLMSLWLIRAMRSRISPERKRKVDTIAIGSIALIAVSVGLVMA